MTNSEKDKVGLFGGTFDPVHMGHLRAAEEIRECFSLEKVFFIPSALPPHKQSSHVTPPEHRLEMLRLAVDSNAHFDISDYEIKRQSTSYTIETLRYLTETQTDRDYYFIVGHELFTEIETWKEYRELFTLSNFIVMTRPGFTNNESDELPLALKSDFSYAKREEKVRIYRNKENKIIAFTHIRGFEISSTEVRQLAAAGKSIKYLVPEQVEDYIASNELYIAEEAS